MFDDSSFLFWAKKTNNISVVSSHFHLYLRISALRLPTVITVISDTPVIPPIPRPPPIHSTTFFYLVVEINLSSQSILLGVWSTFNHSNEECIFELITNECLFFIICLIILQQESWFNIPCTKHLAYYRRPEQHTARIGISFICLRHNCFWCKNKLLFAEFIILSTLSI